MGEDSTLDVHHWSQQYSKSFEVFPAAEQKSTIPNTGIPSLSLNHNSPKNLNLQYYLERKPLNRTDIVIWHDILSNSLTPHHSNNNKPLTIDELIQALITIKHRVKAIVYTRKFGTKELFEVLWKSTGILTINIRTHLLSKKKRNSNRYKHQLLENHTEVEIECSLLKIVFDHRKNLRRLTLKKNLKHANGPPKNALEVKEETNKG